MHLWPYLLFTPIGNVLRQKNEWTILWSQSPFPSTPTQLLDIPLPSPCKGTSLPLPQRVSKGICCVFCSLGERLPWFLYRVRVRVCPAAGPCLSFLSGFWSMSIDCGRSRILVGIRMASDQIKTNKRLKTIMVRVSYEIIEPKKNIQDQEAGTVEAKNF